MRASWVVKRQPGDAYILTSMDVPAYPGAGVAGKVVVQVFQRSCVSCIYVVNVHIWNRSTSGPGTGCRRIL